MRTCADNCRDGLLRRPEYLARFYGYGDNSRSDKMNSEYQNEYIERIKRLHLADPVEAAKIEVIRNEMQEKIRTLKYRGAYELIIKLADFLEKGGVK
jgi:hypothetical protein